MPDPLEPRDRFIRGVWKYIPSERDPSWVDRFAAMAPTGRHRTDIGPTIQRMLDAGVAREDIAHLVRGTSYELAFALLYYLGDPYTAYEDEDVPAEEQISWALFQIDRATSQPVEVLPVLHESFLTADPEGPPDQPGTPRPSLS